MDASASISAALVSSSVPVVLQSNESVWAMTQDNYNSIMTVISNADVMLFAIILLLCIVGGLIFGLIATLRWTA